MKKLVIIDLEKNHNFTIQSDYYILANRGIINVKKTKKIHIDLNKNTKILNRNKKDLFNFFNKIKKNLAIKFNLQANELEIFNLRNDKYNYLDKILFFYSLKKKNLDKKFKVKILTDRDDLKNFYKSTFGIKTEIINIITSSRKKIIYYQLLFSFFKFILKVLYFSTLIKIFKNNYFIKKKKHIYLSLFPYLFNNGDMDIYKKKKLLYLNFSLTDETHLNLKLKYFFKHVKEISKKKNIIPIEQYISYTDLIIILISYLLNFTKFYFYRNKFDFNGIDCECLLREHMIYSYYNRYKLSIYKNSLKRFYKIFKPENLHYFLFEYNFGFFLKNQLKKIKKFIGYQHGIFTKNLMWLNALDKQKNLLPDLVYCNQKDSVSAYKIYFKNKIILNEKKKFPFVKLNICKNSDKILVFLGQHDISDSVSFFLNNSKFKKKKIFFKLHPNNKKNINYNYKNFYFIKKINFNYKYQVFLSPTTALIYDFMRCKKKHKIIGFDYKINLWH
jgi:hypothetical protein